ncbi:MAG: hypothetical protein ACXAC5_25390 [Promethearchaeota archaeon]|jgi:hypothetical protein
MKHDYSIVLALLFLIPNLQYATPSKGATVRQVFLGSNDKYYFTLAMIHANPGSHFEGYDSTFIYKIDIQTNRVIDRDLMTAAYYQKIGDEWNRTPLLNNSSIDMNKYMIENDVHFSLSTGSDYFAKDEIFIDINGLYLIKDKEKMIKLLSPSDFLEISAISELGEITFKEVYTCHRANLMHPESESCYFLKFEYIEPTTGYNKQTFVPLSVKMVREKLKKYGKR